MGFGLAGSRRGGWGGWALETLESARNSGLLAVRWMGLGLGLGPGRAQVLETLLVAKTRGARNWAGPGPAAGGWGWALETLETARNSGLLSGLRAVVGIDAQLQPAKPR